jgi:uncharacterized protein YjbJ (UPF0337 family)
MGEKTDQAKGRAKEAAGDLTGGNESPDDQHEQIAPGQVTDETIEAEERDASASHRADRGPTTQEAADADRHPDVPPESAAAYKEALERGANVKGECQIDQ